LNKAAVAQVIEILSKSIKRLGIFVTLCSKPFGFQNRWNHMELFAGANLLGIQIKVKDFYLRWCPIAFEVHNLYSFREFKSPSFAWCGWTFLRGPCFFDSEDPMWVVSDRYFRNMETSLRTIDKEFSEG